MLRQNVVGSGSAHHFASGVDIGVPVVLHDSVHDLGVHQVERVQLLHVVERVFVEEISLLDLRSDFSGHVEVDKNSSNLLLDHVVDVLDSELSNDEFLLDSGERVKQEHHGEHWVHVGREISFGDVFSEIFFHGGHKSIHLLVRHVGEDMVEEPEFDFQEASGFFERVNHGLYAEVTIFDQKRLIGVPDSDTDTQLLPLHGVLEDAENERVFRFVNEALALDQFEDGAISVVLQQRIDDFVVVQIVLKVD